LIAADHGIWKRPWYLMDKFAGVWMKNAQPTVNAIEMV
jgi:hypothetical protein